MLPHSEYDIQANTIHSPLVEGAWEGRLVHLAGLDVIGSTAGSLARFTQDREVELWENERWAGAGSDVDSAPTDAGWSKDNLRPVERKAWTRGRDGWSGVADDGSGDVRSVHASLDGALD